MKKFFIVGGFDAAYAAMFREFGMEITDQPGAADLAVFTGGADVSPHIYGAARHPSTGCDPRRDEKEGEAFDEFAMLGVPMVGICRGGQFLNVMNGGAMYQHVTNHVGSHMITDLLTGDNIYASSTHHQMMMPSENAVLVACSAQGGTREWYEGKQFKQDVCKQDYEVVLYEETQCLCFQPHPEFSGYKECRAYLHTLLQRYKLI